MTAPEVPTELLCLVRHATPAIQKVNESLVRFGYSHTDPGALSDAEIRAAGLHVVRGCCCDTFWRDRAAMRGDENLEQLRRLPRGKDK